MTDELMNQARADCLEAVYEALYDNGCRIQAMGFRRTLERSNYGMGGVLMSKAKRARWESRLSYSAKPTLYRTWYPKLGRAFWRVSRMPPKHRRNERTFTLWELAHQWAYARNVEETPCP